MDDRFVGKITDDKMNADILEKPSDLDVQMRKVGHVLINSSIPKLS
jgi:hypothetical protein